MGKMYHIGLDESLNCKYAILPGDPGRVEKIAAFLDEPHFVGQNREYTSFVGTIDGERVLVMSTGMGGPSTAIAVEELHVLGVQTMIRIGTCGGINLQVKGGDLVVASGAIRMDGTGREYLPIEFPAVPDFDVLTALVQAARKSGRDSHVGVVHCKDSFYGQHSPERMPVSYELLNKWEAWKRGNTMGSEMESSTLFLVAQVLGIRAGSVFNVVWNKDRQKLGMPDEECHDTTVACKTAVEAIRILIAEDKQKPAEKA